MNKITTKILIVVALLAPTFLGGCGLSIVNLKATGLTPTPPANCPGLKLNPDGKHGSVNFRAVLEGPTTTLSYDGVLWRFADLPAPRCATGEPVLLDTGWPDPGAVSLDVARAAKIPTHMGTPFDFSYVPSLSLGNLRAKDFLAVLISKTWRCRVFGLEIYRTRGWALGTPLLAQADYLAFDNPHAKVTIGREKFQPSPALHWSFYPMTWRQWSPIVKLPVANTTLELMADSGGGPHLTLTSKQWEAIAPSLEVKHHSKGDFPTWGHKQAVNIYVVRELNLGPVHLEDEPVWVLDIKSKTDQTVPTVGLGSFRSATVVWDFQGKKWWVGM